MRDMMQRLDQGTWHVDKRGNLCAIDRMEPRHAFNTVRLFSEIYRREGLQTEFQESPYCAALLQRAVFWNGFPAEFVRLATESSRVQERVDQLRSM